MSPITQSLSYRLNLGTQETRDLQDFARDSRDFFLILGVASKADDVAQLYERDIHTRFAYYAIDLHQYFDRIQGPLPGSIDVPVQNRVNLGTYALLVASKWVESFCAVLQKPRLDVEPGLRALLERMKESLPAFNDPGDLESRIGVIGALGAAKEDAVLAERLSQLASIRAISARLLEGGGGETIDTYSPEALSGMVNLWLFSKQYHEFMRASVQKSGKSRRFLPVAADSLDAISRLEQATLYYVYRYYTYIGAEVAIVRKLAERGGEDYSTWSGALDRFPWIKINEDGSSEFNMIRLSAGPEDAEAIRIAEQSVINDVGFDLYKQGEFGSLSPWQVDLGVDVPVMFFPKEDDYVQYPRQLWTRKPWTSPAL